MKFLFTMCLSILCVGCARPEPSLSTVTIYTNENMACPSDQIAQEEDILKLRRINHTACVYLEGKLKAQIAYKVDLDGDTLDDNCL
ncbi:MAG: hypothetical protein LBV04_05630, partial [Deferribacteraceae bacterium]|nr:hypothetical protein [Deferribacteraceae bacterium]